MMKRFTTFLLLYHSIISTAPVAAADFIIVNGQIFTSGLLIIDSPQPNTPLGGGRFNPHPIPSSIGLIDAKDNLNIALDISGDGKLTLPPYSGGAVTRFNSITIFLSSYATGLNLTVTNGTAGSGDASLGDILEQEEGSTVKHVNWLWPDCLVGNGKPTDAGSARGLYNISIHQSYTLASKKYYTVTPLPISVTNSISANTERPSCENLKNLLLSPSVIDASISDPPGLSPWIDSPNLSVTTATPTTAPTEAPYESPSNPSDSPTYTEDRSADTTTAAPTVTTGPDTNDTPSTSSETSSSTTQTPDFGDPKPEATPEDGLGSGAGILQPSSILRFVTIGAITFVLGS